MDAKRCRDLLQWLNAYDSGSTQRVASLLTATRVVEVRFLISRPAQA